MTPKLKERTQKALLAIRDCNGNGIASRYGHAIDREWRVRQEVEQARNQFDRSAIALRECTRMIFNRVFRQPHTIELGCYDGYAVDHSTQPPTIKPYLKLTVYATQGRGRIDRCVWPTTPEEIEDIATQMKWAVDQLEHRVVEKAPPH